jgi:hypothetical protein
MSRLDRPETNRANSLHSTGPKTPEGKKRSSLNALRHGLTGQTVVLPGEDLSAYGAFCAKYHIDFKPSGRQEEECVQTIADTQWRLHRIRAMENNLFALGFDEQSDNTHVADPDIHRALAQAKGMRLGMDDLTRLSLYEQRLTRALYQAKREIQELQAKRKEAREKDMGEAAKIANLKEALDESWQPSQSGFVFSRHELNVWIARRDLVERSQYFHVHGKMPSCPLPQSVRAGQ